MNCKNEAVELMHKYLDGDLTKSEENELRTHLEDCTDCQKHFHELKRTITMIKSAETIHAPDDFTIGVMEKLPVESKRLKYLRWFKMHPVLTAAAIFFIFMFGSVFTSFSGDNKLTVSKQDDLIIQGDMVIVPEDIVVDGDLVVRNGQLRIDGRVEGDVILINSEMVEEMEDTTFEGEGLMASVGEVSGEFQHIDQAFDWIWYHMKNLFGNIFSFK